MRTISICLIALILSSLACAACVGIARAGAFTEDFSTRTYCDVANTTAWWNTEAGRLELHPYGMQVLGGFPYDEAMLRGFEIEGDYAYLAIEDAGFEVLDIHDPAAFSSVATLTSVGTPRGIDVEGNLVYLASTDYLFVIDIADPRSPWVVGSVSGLTEGQGVTVSGEYAYFASGNAGVYTIDISDPAHPVDVAHLDTPGFATSVTLYGDYAYVADGLYGIIVCDVRDPLAPVIVNRIPIAGEMSQIRIVGNRAYVTASRPELRIYSLAQPAEPLLIGVCPLRGGAQGVDVDGGYAYVTVADNDTTGLYVIDVAVPTATSIVNHVVPPGFPIGVRIIGEYAYLNCFAEGLQVVRIADRVAPAVGEMHFLIPRVFEMRASGTTAYVLNVGYPSAGFTILSVADPEAPQIVGRVDLHDYPTCFRVDGDRAYVGGDDTFLVLDLRDQAVPIVLAEVPVNGYVTDLEVDGDYAYIAIATSPTSILRVFDISDPAAPVAVADMPLPSTPHGMARRGHNLYIPVFEDGQLRAGPRGGLHGGLRTGDRLPFTNLSVVDITNPLAPAIIEDLFIDRDWMETVRVDGDILYGSFWTFDNEAGYGIDLFDISDPHHLQPLGRYADADYYGDVCVAGGLAYFSVRDSRRVEVIDVSNPANPYRVATAVTPCGTGAIARVGDFIYCAGGWWDGITPIRVMDRGTDRDANVAQSLVLPASHETIRWVRLNADERPAVDYAFSADGGAHWQGIPANGAWQELLAAGTEPKWRASLRCVASIELPSVDRIVLSWSDEVPAEVAEAGSSGRLDLHPNAPNPFTTRTDLAFDLPRSTNVRLDVIEASGRLVATILDRDLAAGRHSVAWNGRGTSGRPLASGVYFCRLRALGDQVTRKIEIARN
jgi:hypothetical protein